MLRASLVIFFLVLFSASNSIAGFYSSSYDPASSIVAAVKVENEGIYNLVTSIQFLRKPQDSKIFGTDEYEYLIKQVSVEAPGVILQKILEAKSTKMTDLAPLKMSIENAVQDLVEKTKKKHGVSPNTEVVFSIGNFYLLEPKND
jgi:hypothetical protein